MSRTKLLSVVAGCSGLAVIAAPASAAEPAPGADTLETVVVTAQRRPERPEDVPIFLTAVSGRQLDRMQITDTAGLAKLAPSLVMMRTGAFTQPYLRGVGKRANLGVENSVATYVDGVYLASAIGALMDLRGVERVEILNGPQGTLFGRNASGGVIQVVTRDPRPTPAGEAELHAGSYDYLRGDLYLTGGSERLAGNLAVSLSRNGGYGTNLATGRTDVGDIDHSLVARSKWIWRPAGGLTLTLAADYQDIDQDFTQVPLEGFTPLGRPRIEAFRDADQDSPNRHHFRYGGASLKADAAVGDLNLMSLTAVRSLSARYASDLDMGPNLLFAGAPEAEQAQFSQEFQLQSGEAARLRWSAGLYYIAIEERLDPIRFRYGGSYAASLGGRTEQTLVDTGRVSSYAAYGQATLPLGAATRLTAGLRYTIEHRSVRAAGERRFDTAPVVRPIPGLPLLDAEPFRNETTFREPTWRASVEHQLSTALMAFASVSRGFQSGGWNLQTPQAPPFGPETLTDYEAGLKYVDSTGRFAADAVIFHYDYADVQVSAFTPLGSTTINAASADVTGLDLQFQARVGDGTDLGLGAQILDARFNAFPNAACTDYRPTAVPAYAPIVCDASGARLPFAPKFRLNLRANHRLSLGGAGALELSAVVAYSAGYYSEPDNIIRQDAFATLDASATWRPLRAGPSIRVWVLNLSGARYHDQLATFPTAGVIQRPAAPRRVGASLAYAF